MADNVKHLNDESYEKTVAKGVVLVDFYATWCGPCRMITPIIEEIASEMKDQVIVAKIDVDSAPNAAGSASVTSIPTVILFKDGKEVSRVVGVRDKEYFKEMILNAVAS